MANELITPKQLKEVASPNSSSLDTGSFKGVTGLFKEINSCLSQIVSLANKYPSIKGLVNQEDVKKEGGTIQNKIEKGVEKGLSKQPSRQPYLIFHTGKAIENLKKSIKETITNEMTGKEFKENLENMPEDMLTKTVHDFLRNHVEIK